MLKFTAWTLLKNVAVIEQTLNSTYFNEYPIDINELTSPAFEDIPEDQRAIDKRTGLRKKYTMDTSTHAYADSKSKTVNNEYFAKAFVAFNTLWKR